MADFPIGANVKPAINDIDKLIAALRGAGKAAGLAEDEIEKLVTTAKKGGSDGAAGIDNMKGQLSSLGGIAKTVGPALAGVFALDKLKQFVGEVVNITAEFQKFEAVLTNTLGSNSAAKKALNDITKFASVTPFSVRELTESFVRLANQGFKPTTEELRKLGDLASSTGKGFDQLTEAIIDAQTGEFERLKEFGIRASKAGDQVKFTFKGVQTQTDFTSDSIRKYLLTLGDLDGVSGSMAAISETLGGKISNLGDSWDKFLVTLGDGNKGALSGSVSLLDKALKIATDLVTTTEQSNANFKTASAGAVFDSYKGKSEIERAELKQKIYERILQLQIETSRAERLTREGKSGGVNIADYNKSKADLGIAQESISLIANFEQSAAKEKLQKEEAAAAKLKEARLKAERESNEAIKKERAKFLKEYLADIASGKSTEEGEGMKGDFTFADPSLNLDGLKKVNEDLKAERDRAYEQEYEDKKAQQDRLLEAERAHEEQRRAIRQAAFQFGVELVNTLYLISAQNMQAELDDLQRQKDFELRLTGDNAKSKEKVSADFAKKERALKRKQAEEQQQLSIFNIVANTAESILKIGAQLGVAAPPFQVLAGLQGALQLAVVLNQKLPAFKDGVFDLMGAGTETSDSILARLSAHESVVPARKSRKFKDILKPIIEDENVGYGDLKNIIDRNIPNHLRGDLFVKLKQERDPVMTEVRDILKDIKNKPTTGKGIDAKGLYEYMERDGVVKKTYKQNYFW